MENCVDLVRLDSGRRMVKIKQPGSVRGDHNRPITFIECTADEAVRLAAQIQDAVAVDHALIPRQS